MKFKNFLSLSIFIILFNGCLSSSGGKNIFGFEKRGNKLLTEEKINAIINDSQLGFHPVTINGIPHKLFSDIDGDGIDDIIVLFVKADRVHSMELSSLQSSQRVYDDEVPYSPFTLIAFENKGTHLIKGKSLFLGNYKAIDQIKQLSNHGEENAPVILLISFNNSQESKTKIISFKNFDNINVFDLKKDANSGFYLKDINNDKIPEIVKYQQIEVEAEGNDTRLSFYQWDGEKYSFKDKMLITHELNKFLRTIKKNIESDNREALIHTAFPPWQAKKYSLEKLDMQDILKTIFKPADLQSKAIRHPKEIIFSQILENPFLLQNREKRQAVQIYCRMIFEDLNSDFYKATIVLSDNPFNENQYYFSW